jgi:hypothetical protein
MTASSHLQPEQLKMFMSANEIMSTHVPNPADFEDEDEDFASSDEEVTGNFWDRKLTESMDNGTYDSIHHEGVKEPVNLYTKHPDKNTPKREQRIGNGHHRVAAMNELDPDEVMPVLHHDRDARGRTQHHDAISPGGYPKQHGKPAAITPGWVHKGTR